MDRKERLQVVKITRCKMRAKDTLEIEIGLKSITKRNIHFEERRFILKFLDKLDPGLACKGRILLQGLDLMNLQNLQFGVMQSMQKQAHESSKPKEDHSGSKGGTAQMVNPFADQANCMKHAHFKCTGKEKCPKLP